VKRVGCFDNARVMPSSFAVGVHVPIEQFGDIIAQPIPGGLHHRYADLN
jgi:hypothetical protein